MRSLVSGNHVYLQHLVYHKMHTMKNNFVILLCLLLFCCRTSSQAQNIREKINLDANWKFAYGHAGSMEKDFTHGTEYFTYLAKAQSSDHNRGPIWNQFNDSAWTQVDLPHDWVVDLPYSAEASHSHGYKTVGWRYPETSIGWYRKHFSVPAIDFGKQISVQFDGIFRNAQVFCNGFYLGHEPSGYVAQVYDITEYLNYGGDNLLTVRADATTEEGWYYEGAGIYRHVWLCKTAPVHVAPFGTYVTSQLSSDYRTANVYVDADVCNDALDTRSFTIVHRMTDETGKEIARSRETTEKLLGKSSLTIKQTLPALTNVQLWNLEHPYLYTLHTDIYCDGKLTDSYPTVFGIRSIEFHPDNGFLLNGKPVKIKGTNLHQDHAGVGTGIPDELWAYRVQCLKEMGSNAIRTSHNPATPELLDICDRTGMLVLEENRLMGVNQEHISLLRRMIERDRNHPCVILWSVGNEEWAIEGTESGRRIALAMSEYIHRMDSTRPSTVGNSGGVVLLHGVDVKGYNYLVQNDIEGYRQKHPEWLSSLGTEETTGCGTRNVYTTDTSKGWMAPINRTGEKGVYNVIERGWRFYADRPWLGGLFYWTGFDYRGEPNPLVYPATGSQFGILDYCGFPKDEAYYLQSWWAEEPVLHVSPHWNLKGQEGDSVCILVYSNCDEVELTVNGKNLGRKAMPRNGHLEWTTIYQPGRVAAQGYKQGKKTLRRQVETTGTATQASLEPHKTQLKADGQDIVVLNITMRDAKGREMPDAMNAMTVTLEGPAVLLGYGNGDPAFKHTERPLADKQRLDIQAFSGKAQVLIRSLDGQTGTIRVSLEGDALQKAQTSLNVSDTDL